MSYPSDLDDYPSESLRGELERRTTAVADGKCPYCRQPIATHTCKYKGRIDQYHDAASLPDSENSKANIKSNVKEIATEPGNTSTKTTWMPNDKPTK